MTKRLIISGITAAFASLGLAEGTNANTIQFERAGSFAIDGKGYHKAITDNIAMTAQDTQADGTVCAYLVQMDSSGTVTVKKGEEVETGLYESGNAAVQYPEPDEDLCPVGAVIVECDGVSFTSGTTDLGASGVTASFVDFLGGMPDRPYSA